MTLHVPSVRTSTIRRALRQGSVHLLAGAARVHLISGRLDVIGKTVGPGEHFFVPEGKQAPVEALAGATIAVRGPTPRRIREVFERTIPPDWDRLAETLGRTPMKKVLILGETDTGKTFLATYLVNRLLARGRRVGILDADAGQSAVGPPATLGFAAPREPVAFLSELKADLLYFTGSYSPGINFLEYGVGLSRLLRKAGERVETIVVNAPGWVQGDGGRLLCRSELDLIAPDLLVLLQRENELNYLAARYPRDRIEMLSVPESITATSPAGRKTLRQNGTRNYFKGARRFAIPFAQVATDRCYFLSGQRLERRAFAPIPVLWAERLGPKEGILIVSARQPAHAETVKISETFRGERMRLITAGEEENLEVALNDENNDVRSLGILRRIDFDRKAFVVDAPLPVRLRRKIRIIQFGLVKVTARGTELGSVEPRYF